MNPNLLQIVSEKFLYLCELSIRILVTKYFSYRCPLIRENRELGENPGRTRHCKRRLIHCHWETGKVYKVDDSNSGDLPVARVSHELR